MFENTLSFWQLEEDCISLSNELTSGLISMATGYLNFLWCETYLDLTPCFLFYADFLTH